MAKQKLLQDIRYKEKVNYEKDTNNNYIEISVFKEIESVIVNPTDFLQLSFMHKNACNGSDQPIKYIFGGVIYKSEDMPRGSFKVYSKN